MNMSLQLFLQSVPSTNVTLDLEDISYRTLFTHTLGEQVGSAWDLSKVMLWTPILPQGQRELVGQDAGTYERIPGRGGLYKVQGVAVEAIMGGIFHQFVGYLSPLHDLCVSMANMLDFCSGWYRRTYSLPYSGAPTSLMSRFTSRFK